MKSLRILFLVICLLSSVGFVQEERARSFSTIARQPGILASAQEPKPQSAFKMMEYNWQPDKQASETNVK